MRLLDRSRVALADVENDLLYGLRMRTKEPSLRFCVRVDASRLYDWLMQCDKPVPDSVKRSRFVELETDWIFNVALHSFRQVDIPAGERCVIVCCVVLHSGNDSYAKTFQHERHANGLVALRLRTAFCAT